MSSAGAFVGGGDVRPQNYYCHQCERTVTVTSSPPNSELTCPNCNGTFLEESETAPNPNPPFFDNLPFGGFPIMFSTASPSGGAGAVPIDDLNALFGGGAGRSPNQFDPFAFLNNYFNNIRANGANIQLVFENNSGGEFWLPGNPGDYFLGPGLEQLIQQLAENDPNRYGTPPASKSAVLGLPDIKINEELLRSDSSQCAVCKDTFELAEEANQMPCKHIYHKDCILPWLEMHNSCPVCRYELPTDDPDYENRKTSQQQQTRSANMNMTANPNNNDNIAGWFSADRGNQGNPRTVERRFRISLPGLLRGFGSPAETSTSGGGVSNYGGNNDSSNSNNNGSNDTPGRGLNRGSGGQARQEDLD